MTGSGSELEPAVVEGEVVPVDPQPAGHDEVRTGQAAILPLWASSPAGVLSVAGRGSVRVLRLLAFHGVRVPVYWARLSRRSPYGVARLAGIGHRWRTDTHGDDALRTLMASGLDGKPAARLLERHERLVRRRTRSLLLGAAAALTPAAVLCMLVPGRVWLAVAVVALPLLGMFGRLPSERIVSRAVNTEEVPRFTADLILTALGSLGIGELNRALSRSAAEGRDGVGWPSPIVRDGKGWRAEIDLPAGVTATKIIDRRDELASGLRRPLASVWPEPDDGVHAGRLILYVSDQPLSQTKQGAWPLASKGTVDLFEPQPIGINPRGQVVHQVLMFASKIIGAVPRMGKTFTLRLDLLIAALDVNAELHAYDLKGGADSLPLEPVCYRFRAGSDDEDLDYLLRDVRAMRDDMTRRYKTLRGLPREICPEGKVTPELAKQRRYGLFPVVVAIDECQVAFEDETRGKELERGITDLVKRGPAVGIMVILATQRPDARSLPTGISGNAVLRFCLKVMGQVENDMVLGTSAYKNGTRATQFGRKERGVGYLAGEGDDPVIVRTFYVDAPAAEKVVARARAARVAAGTLLGHAAGQDLDLGAEQDTDTILNHLAEVWPFEERTREPRPRVWWEQLAEALADRYPLYADTTADAVRESSGLRSYQVKATVDGKQVNKRGPLHADLIRVLSDRVVEHTEGDADV